MASSSTPPGMPNFNATGGGQPDPSVLGPPETAFNAEQSAAAAQLAALKQQTTQQATLNTQEQAQFGQNYTQQGVQNTQEQTAFNTNQATANSLRGLLTAANTAPTFTPQPLAAVAPIAPVDNTSANAAAFARAKDTTGLAATGAVAGLRSTLGGEGMLGSGSDFRGTQAIANTGLEQEANVASNQATTNSEQAMTAAQANQAAATAARGQTLQANAAAANTAVAEQNAQNNQRNMILQALLAASKY